MKVIEVDNVNAAYVLGLQHLREVGYEQESRAGKVLVAPRPVTTAYSRPKERVLFEQSRDANPFFHIMEALWMLSGSREATWLDRFVGDFSSRFAEDGGLMHGAYGYRWRWHFDIEGGGLPTLPDQLKTIVTLLRNDPYDRRVVLTMWDPAADLGQNKKDHPCNTHAYFRVRKAKFTFPELVLDMTVCCRSNDAIFGCYGANAVHFSVLQEYLAARIGARVGTYYQMSNNFHAYLDVLNKVGYPVDHNYYWQGMVETTPMFTDPEHADLDILRFVEWVGNISQDELPVGSWNYFNPWFRKTAEPLVEAHWRWKNKERIAALEVLDRASYMAQDWKLAAQQWMERRMSKSSIY